MGIKMKRTYYVTGYIGEGARRMFRDLEQQDNVVMMHELISHRWKRYVFFRLYGLTSGFQHLGWLKRLLFHWFAVFHIRVAENSVLIFVNSMFASFYDSYMVKMLKSRYPRLKMVLYMVDPMHGFSKEDNLKVISMMDKVYSAHRNDCKKYGFTYYPLPYSSPDILCGGEGKTDNSRTRTTDLYYLGSGIDRTEQLDRIAKECVIRQIHTSFHVVSGQKQPIISDAISFHQQTIPYEQNERWIRNSNCLLEIMHDGFHGPTQRYMEAVVFGKRLLTNNISVTELDFYNPKYMRIFHSWQDIDYDFINDTQVVDYVYRGEFAPIHFIEKIDWDL